MITTLSGSNQFLIREKLKDIQEIFTRQFGTLNVIKIDVEGKTFDEVMSVLQALSLFSLQRLIILLNPSLAVGWTENITVIINQISDADEVIFVETALDKRTTYFKELKKLTNFFDFFPLDSSSLIKWIINLVAKEKGKISYDDAKYIVELIGNNQIRLSNEIYKLISYNTAITKESIDLLVEPSIHATVFELIDAAFRGNSAKVVSIYKKLQFEDMKPPLIIATIAWQLHIFALLKTADTSNITEIIQSTKLSPYVVEKSGHLITKLSLAEIIKMTNDLVGVSLKIKDYNIDQDEVLINYLLSLII